MNTKLIANYLLITQESVLIARGEQVRHDCPLCDAPVDAGNDNLDPDHTVYHCKYCRLLIVITATRMSVDEYLTRMISSLLHVDQPLAFTRSTVVKEDYCGRCGGLARLFSDGSIEHLSVTGCPGSL